MTGRWSRRTATITGCWAAGPWGVEDCFAEAKNEAGLDHYQVRATAPGTGTSPCPCRARVPRRHRWTRSALASLPGRPGPGYAAALPARFLLVRLPLAGGDEAPQASVN